MLAEVRCIKVIRNSTRAVSGSFDHTLRLWNLVTGKEIYLIQEDHSGYEHFALLQVDEATDVIYSVSGHQVRGFLKCFLKTRLSCIALQFPIGLPTVLAEGKGATIHH